MTAAAFRAWRLAHGWSVRQAAHLLRVTPAAAYHWEDGSQAIPGRIEAQCAALDIPGVVAQLLARYGPLPSARVGWPRGEKRGRKKNTTVPRA